MSFQGGGNAKRTKSMVRFAVEEENERHGSSSMGMSNLMLGMNGHTNGHESSTSSSPATSSMNIGLGVGHGSATASNPQAKINRTRSISKTFSSLELQFQIQQQDKYDTMSFKVGKIMFCLLVGSIATLAMVLSKTSMLYTVSKIRLSSGDNLKQDTMSEYLMSMLFMTLAPVIVTAITDLGYYWVRETKEKKQDPKAKKVRPHAIMLLAFIEGLLEALGITLFFMLVLPSEKTDGFIRIFLLNGLGVIPILGALIMKWKKWLNPDKNGDLRANSESDLELREMENGQLRGEKKKDGADICSRLVVTGVQILFLSMQLAGMALIMIHTGLWWEIPLSLILCSISWWKNFVFVDRLEVHWADAFKRNRYASSFVKSVTKVIFIVILMAIMGKYKYDLDLGGVFGPSNFVDVLLHGSGMHYTLLGSWVAFYIMWISCLACLQVSCVALPVFLTTPLSLVYQAYTRKYYIFGETATPPAGTPIFSSGPELSGNEGLLITAGVLLWLSLIIVTGHLWTGIDKRDANQQEEDMWTQPEPFSCIFIEESVALNRNRNPKVVKSLDGATEYGFHAHRTYITTTMYHETKTEMTKLVMSLLSIDAEIPTEDKVADYYEAHIIFDDAFLKSPNPKPNPNHLDYSPYYNEWVLFLMEIFQELKLKRLGDAVVVWYGEVLTFKFALGMKLVVHLKDVTKIRQKKRWSQILYMHCILEDVLDNENKLGMLDSNTFILMIDGDTQFSRKSINLMRHLIELDRVRSGAVCGRIFPEGSSNPVVWYQKFEYAVGHWLQKTAEHVFGSVLCSPGCFSLVRVAALYRKSGEDMDGQMPAIESYSKEVESAMDVLKFDQGEDRMLSTLIIKNGWRLQYCAGAEAGTFCPEGFGDFFKQRRRWISSTLANLYFLISCSVEIVKTNASVSFPFMLYTAGTFASSIFGPATVVLVVIGGMAYAFFWTGALAYALGLGMPLGYCALCAIFNLDMETDTPRKKSKKIDIQIAGAFVLCATYALLMGAVAVGVSAQIVEEPAGPDGIFLFTLIGIFVVSATLHGEFWLLIYGIIYLFFLPTMYLLLIIFAIANTHDQSWGTRDTGSGNKQTDADKFFSVSKVGTYVRDLKNTFKEAFYDIPPPKPVVEDDDPWKQMGFGGDGKEELVVLEEERRRLQEEKKKQEEEKKKQEEERKLKEIERQKEETRKKKAEAEERDKLQERLKQERRRGIHHKYKDLLSALSRRLKAKVAAPEKGNEKDIAAQKLEQIRSLAALQQMCCFMMFLCTFIWLILVVVVGIHPELNVIGTNAVGIMFLIAFGFMTVLQFFAAILHRLETMFNALANIPMTFDFRMVDEGKKYEKMMALKQQQAEGGESVQRERVAAKVARKLLMVDKRTSTKANLFST